MKETRVPVLADRNQAGRANGSPKGHRLPLNSVETGEIDPRLEF